MVPWCSGLTCGPVKAEIAGSNPVGTASLDNLMISHQVVFYLIAFKNRGVPLAEGLRHAAGSSEFDSLEHSNRPHLLKTWLVKAELISIAFFIANCIETSLMLACAL